MLVGLLLVANLQANELIVDIGYEEKQTAADIKFHAKHNVFLTSGIDKDVTSVGLGYGYHYKEFVGIGSVLDNGDIELYVAFKPKTILYSVGFKVVSAKKEDEDRLELEYAYYLDHDFGFVIKYDTRRDFFIGVRKWL